MTCVVAGGYVWLKSAPAGLWSLRSPRIKRQSKSDGSSKCTVSIHSYVPFTHWNLTKLSYLSVRTLVNTAHFSLKVQVYLPLLRKPVATHPCRTIMSSPSPAVLAAKAALASIDLSSYDPEQSKLMDERCILVDENDTAIGAMDKKTCQCPAHNEIAPFPE